MLRFSYFNIGTLSLLTNDQGGIVDDCIVTRINSKCFYIVANAACADKDKRFLTVLNFYNILWYVIVSFSFPDFWQPIGLVFIG